MARYKCSNCDRHETINLFTPEVCSSCGGRMILQIDPERRPRFDFLSTPSEAWLLVHRSIFERLGLSLDTLSGGSRVSNSGTLALIEDPDAIRFMDLWCAREGSISINENHFNPKIVFDWPCLQSGPSTAVA